MNTLREAAQQALEALEFVGEDMPHWAAVKRAQAITALRAGLAQQEQEQEPVAWRFKGMMGMPWSLSDDGYYVSCKRDKGYTVEPLWASPPRREWQGLSEEEIGDGRDQLPTEDLCNWSFRQGVYFAEAALKEKNNG